jgi:hypothetical protein
MHFSASCFNDRGAKVSVDRANLRRDADEAKLSPTDGIIKLLTKDIREMAPIPAMDGGQDYVIDVHARAILADNPEGLPENLAHAQIEANPDFPNSSRFRKLKEALALLADRSGWFVLPS